jgi:hypothetical protein
MIQSLWDWPAADDEAASGHARADRFPAGRKRRAGVWPCPTWLLRATGWSKAPAQFKPKTNAVGKTEPFDGLIPSLKAPEKGMSI